MTEGITYQSDTLPGVADEWADMAASNVDDTVHLALEHGPGQRALVVYDRRTDLSRTLETAYRRALPDAVFMDFDTVAPDDVLAAFAALAARDLVVLVQSTSFRLEAYRLRIELFKRGLKVIEHIHLSRMPGEQGAHYIASLAYDPAYYRGIGRALQQRINAAPYAVVDSGNGALLRFDSPLEGAKVNIGDYTGMNNIGGQFPIGEVFTEAQDLEAVNGAVRVFVFGDTHFLVNRPEHPITMIVEKGRVTGAIDSTPEFDNMLAIIREHEGEVWLRELGFGMNRAFSRDRMVNDIGTYERMCGIHLSLGAKHGQYQKPQFKRKDARYHVDVFAVTEAVYLGEHAVYQNGAWQP